MEKLVALVDIQYKGKLYIPGEEIPTSDPEMVAAWKRAGSVKVLAEAEKERPEKESAPEPDKDVDTGKGEEAGKVPSDKEPDSRETVKKGEKKK